jgi:hypothetical protein
MVDGERHGGGSDTVGGNAPVGGNGAVDGEGSGGPYSTPITTLRVNSPVAASNSASVVTPSTT